MMSESFKRRLFKKLPEIYTRFGTPFHIYDERGIVKTSNVIKSAFKGIDFQEFFAVKALPNPEILNIIGNQGFSFDCSSIPELQLAEQAPRHDRIMFTSNNTSIAEFRYVEGVTGCVLNLDDITLIEKVPGQFPKTICFRYNPGSKRTGNSIIGKPEEAKYGVTDSQILKAYAMAKKKGAKFFGLHTMLCSNELDYHYMVDTVKSLLELVERISSKLKIKFDFINMGGGLGIPYKPEQKPFNIKKMADEIRVLINSFEEKHGYVPSLYMESGRYITGPHGVLVTKVINQKHIYREYRGVDACMSSLMRPGMYGAYHHINVLNPKGAEKIRKSEIVDVVGSLCENNDKFAIQRKLPKMSEEDFVVISDTGAHGIAMCFQYNGRLRPKELLLRDNGDVEQIAREETSKDLFARYFDFMPEVLSFK
jgi:diaminopimelate decarboxylase